MWCLLPIFIVCVRARTQFSTIKCPRKEDGRLGGWEVVRVFVWATRGLASLFSNILSLLFQGLPTPVKILLPTFFTLFFGVFLNGTIPPMSTTTCPTLIRIRVEITRTVFLVFAHPLSPFVASCYLLIRCLKGACYAFV